MKTGRLLCKNIKQAHLEASVAPRVQSPAGCTFSRDFPRVYSLGFSLDTCVRTRGLCLPPETEGRGYVT